MKIEFWPANAAEKVNSNILFVKHFIYVCFACNCLEFIYPTRKYFARLKSPLPVKGCKLWSKHGTINTKQSEFFIVSQLFYHGTSVWMAISKDRCHSHLFPWVWQCKFRSKSVFKHPNIRMQGKFLFDNVTALVCTIKLSISLIKCKKDCLGRDLTFWNKHYSKESNIENQWHCLSV